VRNRITLNYAIEIKDLIEAEERNCCGATVLLVPRDSISVSLEIRVPGSLMTNLDEFIKHDKQSDTDSIFEN